MGYAAFSSIGCCLALACLLSGCDAPERRGGPDPFAAIDRSLAAPEARVIEERPVGSPSLSRQSAIRGFIRRPTQPRPGASRSTDRSDPGAVDGGEITLDFNGSDLAGVIDVLMRDGLGLNYILNPGVSGTVTFRTNRPIRSSEILPTLEEILRLNGAALVQRGGLYTIVPRAEAGLSAPITTFRDVAARGLTVRVTPLRYVRVDDIAEVLDGFAPVAGSIRYDRRSDLVFTIGSAAEQKTLLDLIATLDINRFAGRAFALRPLREAPPNQVADELTQLFASPAGEASQEIRFLPIERMNAVLVITDQEDLLDQALRLLRDLDQGLGDAPRIFVYPVRNRQATDVADLLGEVFEIGKRNAASPGRLAPGLTPREDGASAIAGAAGPGGELPALGNTALGGELGSRPSGVLSLTADESSNSIIALATTRGAEALVGALRQLDVQPLQVLLEATLVEVELNDRLEYGVRWFLQSGNFNFSFGDVVGDTISAGAGNIFPGFNAAFRTTDIQVTLSALDEVTDVRILSSPTLMVLDNQKARLQVGDQVPIVTRSSVSTEDPNAPIVAETEYRDTGVILEISPTVNAGGLVVLEIRQEISTVVDAGDAVNPTFSQRVVESVIAVDSGETIALAGLIEESQSRGRDGIPILSEIPIAGALFGTRADAIGRSELLVLIRPLVVRDQRDARAATLELRRKLISLVPEERDQSLNNSLTPFP